MRDKGFKRGKKCMFFKEFGVEKKIAVKIMIHNNVLDKFSA